MRCEVETFPCSIEKATGKPPQNVSDGSKLSVGEKGTWKKSKVGKRKRKHGKREKGKVEKRNGEKKENEEKGKGAKRERWKKGTGKKWKT